MTKKRPLLISASLIILFTLTCIFSFDLKAGPEEVPCEDCYRYLPINGYIQTYQSVPCFCGETFIGYYQNCISVPGYPGCGTFLHCDSPCTEIYPSF